MLSTSVSSTTTARSSASSTRSTARASSKSTRRSSADSVDPRPAVRNVADGRDRVAPRRPALRGRAVERAARDAKTDVIVARPGMIAAAHGRVDVRAVAVSTTAEDSLVAIGRVEQIPAPLPRVAEHVEETEEIRHLAADVLRVREVIRAGPGDIGDGSVLRLRRSGATRELPLGLGRQAVAVGVDVPRDVFAVVPVRRIQSLPL